MVPVTSLDAWVAHVAAEVNGLHQALADRQARMDAIARNVEYQRLSALENEKIRQAVDVFMKSRETKSQD